MNVVMSHPQHAVRPSVVVVNRSRPASRNEDSGDGRAADEAARDQPARLGELERERNRDEHECQPGNADDAHRRQVRRDVAELISHRSS
jgi:hypothetical protein